jgi:alpha-galactosidase
MAGDAPHRQRQRLLPTLLSLLLLNPAAALDDGLCSTPIMGMNSWTAFGAAVTEADLLDVGKFFISSGLREAGYQWINSDDGWDTHSRGADGRLQPDLEKFPDGIKGLTQKLGAMNLSFGIYTAESSVVCSGRPGTLFQEYLDAATFAEWGVKLVKNDNCTRKHALAAPRDGNTARYSTSRPGLTCRPDSGIPVCAQVVSTATGTRASTSSPTPSHRSALR